MEEHNPKTHNKDLSNAVRDGLGIPRLEHPPASTGLNPIEGMWQLSDPLYTNSSPLSAVKCVAIELR